MCSYHLVKEKVTISNERVKSMFLQSIPGRDALQVHLSIKQCPPIHLSFLLQIMNVAQQLHSASLGICSQQVFPVLA